MKKVRLNQILFFLIFGAVFALTLAYISEYHFDFMPCQLCLYQRKPFFAIIAICALTLAFFKTKKAKSITILAALVLLLINASIGVYHVGVEKKIFKISESCAAQEVENVNTIEELKILLSKSSLARCDEPKLFLFGLSMANWNVLYCLMLMISTILLYRKAKS